MNEKILIISCDSFSNSNSNGRTMKNMLLTVPKENLAQFYIHGTPDTDFCHHFYKVSDNDALHAFLRKNKEDNTSEIDSNNSRSADRRISRTYRNLVIRNLIWLSHRWWDKDYEEFLDGFSPSIVLLQAGDSPFMYDIAIRTAKRCKAKLMMFNTESYVLKKYMYASTKKFDFWHHCLMCSLKKYYQRFMNASDYCIYNTEALEVAYQQKYPHNGKSCVLYTVSEFLPLKDNSKELFTVLYCGNLGVGRAVALAEFAEVLGDVDSTAQLHIYGKFKNEDDEELVCSHHNVHYKGFVDYDNIPSLMSEASLLLHCENGERLENLRYAFSTKIADSLASGRPFLVYADKEYPFVQYLLKNQCAHVASDERELRLVLERCMSDRAYLYQYTKNAVDVAKANHSIDVNCRKMNEIIDQLSH